MSDLAVEFADESLAERLSATDPRLRLLGGVDRHDAVAVQRLLDEPTIRITAPSAEWRHQVLLLVLVDLLGRLYPRIAIEVDTTAAASPVLPPGPISIGERISAVRARSPVLPQPAGATPAITVHIGPGDTGADLYVDAAEWQSYLGTVPSRLPAPHHDSAIGPLAAACRAGAQVHATLIGSVRVPAALPDQTYSSALTYQRGPDPLDDPTPVKIGPIDGLLVGAGSVGGAAALTIGYEPEVTGRLGVCDAQTLEDRNPYRAVLATAEAAARHAVKVHEVDAALDHHGALDVDPRPMTITDWEAAQAEQPVLPLVLVAVDSLEDRERIQDALPLDVINAAVNADVIAISGHRTGSGPCMCCLHMPQKLDSYTIKNRLIARATGLAERAVNQMRVSSTRLTTEVLNRIEDHCYLAENSFAQYAGKTLDDLYLEQMIYGETEVTTSSGTRIAVATPFVTALAGVLLAGEAFKRSTPELAEHALGPDGPGIRYWEDCYEPQHGHLDRIVEESPHCLCKSARRQRLLQELHH